jgi:hypothetical protein
MTMPTVETIVSNMHGDAPRCVCGNDVMDEGFYPADPRTREYVEATVDGPWDGKTIMCGYCGRLIDQTLRPNPAATDEWDSHLMTVVRGPAGDLAMYQFRWMTQDGSKHAGPEWAPSELRFALDLMHHLVRVNAVQSYAVVKVAS